jgi:hypothetical protein
MLIDVTVIDVNCCQLVSTAKKLRHEEAGLFESVRSKSSNSQD